MSQNELEIILLVAMVIVLATSILVYFISEMHRENRCLYQNMGPAWPVYIAQCNGKFFSKIPENKRCPYCGKKMVRKHVVNKELMQENAI